MRIFELKLAKYQEKYPMIKEHLLNSKAKLDECLMIHKWQIFLNIIHLKVIWRN